MYVLNSTQASMDVPVIIIFFNNKKKVWGPVWKQASTHFFNYKENKK